MSDPFILPNGTKINSLLYANWVTKLSKRALFILQNMDVKNQSKEDKNNDISKTPKEIH